MINQHYLRWLKCGENASIRIDRRKDKVWEEIYNSESGMNKSIENNEFDRLFVKVWKDEHCIYIGDWCSGFPDGRGIMKDADNNIYEGFFSIGKYHGYGCLIESSGSYYEGEFRYGRRRGIGRCLYPNGTYYMGYFCDRGCYEIGLYYFNNGDIYFGSTLDDVYEGFGLYYNECEKSCYVGDWKGNLRNGMGVARYNDGKYYVGEWEENMKNGIGVIESDDGGERYRGEWNMNKPNGYGIYINGDTVMRGLWKDGILRKREEFIRSENM